MVLASGTAMDVMELALIGPPGRDATLVLERGPQKCGRKSMLMRVRAVVIDARAEIPP